MLNERDLHTGLVIHRDLLLSYCTSLAVPIGRCVLAFAFVDLSGEAATLLERLMNLLLGEVPIPVTLIASGAVGVWGGVSVYQSVTSAVSDSPRYFLSAILPKMASWRGLRLTIASKVEYFKVKIRNFKHSAKPNITLGKYNISA